MRIGIIFKLIIIILLLTNSGSASVNLANGTNVTKVGSWQTAVVGDPLTYFLAPYTDGDTSTAAYTTLLGEFFTYNLGNTEGSDLSTYMQLDLGSIRSIRNISLFFTLDQSVACCPASVAHSRTRVSSDGTSWTVVNYSYTTGENAVYFNMINTDIYSTRYIRQYFWETDTEYPQSTVILYDLQVWSNAVASIPFISSPSNNSNHYNNTINITWNQSTDEDSDSITYDFWLSNQSDFSTTVNRTNFTNNYTGNITTTDGTTYYTKVRSYDGINYSNWSSTIQFTEITLFTPPSPTSLSSSQGNFWINYTWTNGSGIVTNSFNISQNSTWTNGTTNNFFNSSVGAHGWSNISVYAFNSSGNTSLNITPVSANTQITNNPITISNISDTYNLAYGATLSIYPTYSDADSDIPAFVTTATNGTFYTNNGTLIWQNAVTGTYNWLINVTDGNGSTSSKSFGVSVDNALPGAPLDLSNTTGNFWINHTWGYSVNTNSFNVSQNGTWTNLTTVNFSNNSVGAHGWSNISVYGYNSSSSTQGNASSQNSQVPNNPVLISNISTTYSLTEGQRLAIYPSSTDTDSDTPTFARNFNNGTFYTNNGTLIWDTVVSDNGTYNWQINVTDGYNNVTFTNFTVTVGVSTPTAPTITNTTGNFWANHTLTRGSNTDTYNISQNSTWTNGTTNNFFNSSVGAHGWSNITVWAWNNTGSVQSPTNVSENVQVPDNAPTIAGSGSISSSSFYTTGSTTISITNVSDFDGDSLNPVLAGVTLVGGNEVNYTMTNTAGTNNWTYSYSTLSTGTYSVTAFYVNNSYGSTKKTVSISFTVTTAPVTINTGGGGGGSSVVIIQSENGTSKISFTNITSMESLKNLAELGECFSSGLMLSNKCAQSAISIVDEPLNWWTWFGSYIGSLSVLFIIALKHDEKKKFAANVLLYGTISWVMVVMLSFMGLNLYIWNYIFNSPLPGFMFLSFTMWGVVVTVIGDSYSKRKR